MHFLDASLDATFEQINIAIDKIQMLTLIFCVETCNATQIENLHSKLQRVAHCKLQMQLFPMKIGIGNRCTLQIQLFSFMTEIAT